ncbi:myosin-crossreactive antigen [Bradyrhizobium japonicum]
MHGIYISNRYMPENFMCSASLVSRLDPPKQVAPRNAYLVGTGIAALAAAAYLVKEGGLSGPNIVLFEQMELFGGSLDAHGNPKDGYVMRGGRMFEERFNCTYDLLSFIPSIADPMKSAKDELMEFHQEFFWNDRARLVSGGQIVDVSDLGFRERDRLDLIALCATPESVLDIRTIQDWFEPHFFRSNFWFIWSTTFAFAPWHSAIEFKRYCLRFLHLFSTIDTMAGIYRTQFNQFDAMVRPIVAWLKARGVRLEMGAEVTDIDVVIEGGQKTATRLHYRQGGEDRVIDLAEQDLVFVTNGSMTSDTSYGSMDTVSGAEYDAKWRFVGTLGTSGCQESRLRVPRRLRFQDRPVQMGILHSHGGRFELLRPARSLFRQQSRQGRTGNDQRLQLAPDRRP